MSKRPVHVRLYSVTRRGKTYQYTQLVESVWRDDGVPVHHVVANLSCERPSSARRDRCCTLSRGSPMDRGTVPFAPVRSPGATPLNLPGRTFGGGRMVRTARLESGPAGHFSALQAVCVSDCQSLQNGACGTGYAALQACAVGESVTCSAAGIPIVAACATEQAAFVACLN
jgi:hypothetical protein